MKIFFLIFGLFFSMCCFAQKSPSSISVITGSYTVPLKKFARVIASVEGAGTVTINGSTALRGASNSVLSSSLAKMSTSMPNAFLTFNDGGAGGTNLAFVSGTDIDVAVYDFFAPSGTVINGTGTWRAVIELYER